MLSARFLDEAFESQAMERPDQIAIWASNQTITYRDLNTRASRVGDYLKGLGVGPDSLVGLCVERSVELIVGMIGILKAGAAYVPIDPMYPVERIRFLLEDSGVSLILTSQSMECLSSCVSTVINIRDDAYLSAPSNPVKAGARSNGDLAYVIYTSGSTGTPSGVLIEHRSVLRLFAQTEHWFHFGS